MIDYHIHAIDGDIGHAGDFILDDESWVIRYLVVDTGIWLHGRSVLVSPQRIEKTNWSDSKIRIDLPKDQIKESPKYDPSVPVNYTIIYTQRLRAGIRNRKVLSMWKRCRKVILDDDAKHYCTVEIDNSFRSLPDAKSSRRCDMGTPFCGRFDCGSTYPIG